MLPWLLIAAAVHAVSAPNAGTGLNGLAPVEIGDLATGHVLDFRIRQEASVPGPVPMIRGMIVQHGIAPNAVVGLGLSNLYDRRNSGSDANGARPKRSRKPAVTFVLKF